LLLNSGKGFDSEMRISVSDRGRTRGCGEAYIGTPQPPTPRRTMIRDRRTISERTPTCCGGICRPRRKGLP
jgi:hypothetical protein